MAPFDQFPQFLIPSSILRPVHVTLTEPRTNFHTIVRTIQDPYFQNPSYRHHEAVFSPSFDVRESDSAFFLEGEFPGVSQKGDILIEKLGPMTLLVEANVARFDLDEEWGQHQMAPADVAPPRVVEQVDVHVASSNGGVPREHHHREKQDGQKNPWSEQQGLKGNVDGLRVRLEERHVGYLQRSFTFPSPVDIDALKARLRCGLLVMMVPKMRDGKNESRKIHIED